MKRYHYDPGTMAKTVGGIFAILLLILPGGIQARAQSTKAGTIMGDAVNVRSGPNINFEIINKLDKESVIAILGQDQDWYKIQIPLGSQAYVHKKFVSLERGMLGSIQGKRVNIRAGAGTKFNVLGQLNSNDRIAIIGQEGEWFKIYSFTPLTAWIHRDFVQTQGDLGTHHQREQSYQESFLQLERAERREDQERQKPSTQQDMAAVRDAYQNLLQSYPRSPVAQIAAKRLNALQQEPASSPRTLAASPRASTDTVTDIVSVEGKIMATGRYLNRRWTHKLVQDKKVLYYLKSDSLNLNDFVYYQVTVWGTVEQLSRSAISLMLVTQVKPLSER